MDGYGPTKSEVGVNVFRLIFRRLVLITTTFPPAAITLCWRTSGGVFHYFVKHFRFLPSFLFHFLSLSRFFSFLPLILSFTFFFFLLFYFYSFEQTKVFALLSTTKKRFFSRFHLLTTDCFHLRH